MQAFAPALPLAVGLSGGADSTALLLASAGAWRERQNGSRPAVSGVAPAGDATLERLARLLSLNDMDALALFESEADGLRARLGDATMEAVGRLMDTLDFAAAARLLQGESAA